MGRRSGRRVCGVCGNVREIRIRARDGHPDICGGCAPRRPGACGVCGGRPDRAQGDGDSPAVGICCYRLPLAVCIDCGRERPCYSRRGRSRCARAAQRCGARRSALTAASGGSLTAVSRAGCCAGRVTANAAARPRACDVCGYEGAADQGLCPACRFATAGRRACRRRGPVAPRPRWRRSSRSSATPRTRRRCCAGSTRQGSTITRRLLAGEIAITHQGLDEAASGRPARSRSCAPRSWTAECSSRAMSTARGSPRGTPERCSRSRRAPDRANVRAYATWEVARSSRRAVIAAMRSDTHR